MAARDLKVLVENQNNIVSIPAKQLLTNEITEMVREYENSLIPPKVEEDVEVEEEVTEDIEDFTTYVFKDNEEGVFYKPDTYSNHNYMVVTHNKYINMKMKYPVFYDQYAEGGLERLKERYFNHSVRNFYRLLSQESTAPERAIDLVTFSFIRGNGHFNYKNRDGMYIQASYKKNDPTTAYNQKIFEQLKSQDLKMTTLGGTTSRKFNHPHINNIYDDLRLCWGSTRFAGLLTSSKDIVQATNSLLNFFVSTEYNTDLGTNVRLSEKSIYKAVKRACNAPETNLTDEEYAELKDSILERLNPESGYWTFNKGLPNTQLILMCSALNIDLHDIYLQSQDN